MFREWRRRRRVAKVRRGDGSALKPLRLWHVLTRTVFFLDLEPSSGPRREYAVLVDYLADEWDVRLYRDGSQESKAKLPAAFPVPGGVIEVATTTYGLKRMHFVPDDDGEPRQLRPHPRSGEGLRARFDHRHPRASRAVGIAAVVVLLVALAVGLPQIVEWVSGWEVVADNVGTFTSPFAVPFWLNTTLLVAGVLAATERALTLRNHWLIDAETWWMGD